MELSDLSLLTGARLKAERERLGLSHLALRDAILEKYGIEISKDSLINYEVSDANHTKAYKNNGMRVEYLRYLADFYGVSTDWLLGVSDYRLCKNNEQTIQSLGIPERFVSEVDFLRNNPGFGLDIFCKLLENDNFWEAIASIYGLSALPPFVRSATFTGEEYDALSVAKELVSAASKGTLGVAHVGFIRSGAMFEIQERFLNAAVQSARPGEAKWDCLATSEV